MPVSRAVAYFACFSAITSAFAMVAMPWALPMRTRLEMIGLAMLGLLLALCVLRQPRRFVWLLLGPAYAAALYPVMSYASGLEAPLFKVAEGTFWSTILSAFLVLLIGGVFRFSPLKISMGLTSMVFAILALNLIEFFSRPAASGAFDSSVGAYEWGEPHSLPHPDLEFVNMPGAYAKTYYSSDPRGCFDKEPPPSTLDMRLWRPQAAKDAQMELRIPEKHSGVLSVVKLTLGKWKVPNDLVVRQGRFAVFDDEEITVRFRARAKAARPVSFAMTPVDGPYKVLTEEWTVTVTDSWRDYAKKLRVLSASPRARLDLLLGASDVPVELSDVAMESRGSAPENFPIRQYSMTYHFNSHGYRDRERSLQPAKGVFRIACLGDSFVFGQGVRLEDLVTTRLEETLSKRFAGHPPIEVLNFGVCGYSTRLERICFETSAVQFKPNLVLVLMVSNDDLSGLEEERLGLNAEANTNGAFVTRAAAAAAYRLRLLSADFSVCVEEMKKLDAFCKSRDIPLVAINFRTQPEVDQFTKTVMPGLAAAKIPTLDLADLFFPRHSNDDLRVHPADAHPSPLAHSLAAEAIEKFLDENHLLPRASEKPRARNGE